MLAILSQFQYVNDLMLHQNMFRIVNFQRNMEKYIKRYPDHEQQNSSFIIGIHWSPMNSPHKGSVMWRYWYLFICFSLRVYLNCLLWFFIMEWYIRQPVWSKFMKDPWSHEKGPMLYVLYYITTGFMSTLKLWKYFSNKKKKHVKVLKRTMLLWNVAWLCRFSWEIASIFP